MLSVIGRNRDGHLFRTTSYNPKIPPIFRTINSEPCQTIVVETGYQTRRENNGAKSLCWELRERETSFVFGVQIVTE